ncbi:MAG: NAD(P)/FAD-dependent oxidoreductase [Solirubrobacteraceae bacterium]
MSEKRILIVGGGFAGVHAAVGASATLRAARERAVAVELVSPDPYLVIRPRLYEADLSGVCVPLSGLLEPIGVRHRRARVIEIDAASQTVRLEDESDRLRYDQLVFAAGSGLTLPAGQRVHAADTYAQARALNQAVCGLAHAPERQFSVLVVGGGFTGLELAAELAGTLERTARVAGRRAGGHVLLIERSPKLAPGFGTRARGVIEHALGALGVEVRTGVGVSDVRPDGLVLDDGSRVDAELVAWSAGPRASVLAEQIPARRDGLGRLEVDPFLATGVDGVWAAGDSAAASVDGEHLAVMSCQHAMPQGRRAGENAAAAVLGKPPRRYRQPLYLTCLDLGDYGALLTCGFDRNTILVTGQQAKKFKRYINRSLIYPPPSADTKQMLRVGRPEPAGAAMAALIRLALRSDTVRNRVTGAAEDRAALFADNARTGTGDPRLRSEERQEAVR